MKAIIAILMGLFSGFLIYLIATIVFIEGESSSSLFTYTTFFGGWILSSYIMLRGAKTISKVISRGFLMGTAEWLAMIPAGLLFAGKDAIETVSISEGSNISVAGVTIGGGLFAFLTGGVSIGMAIVCLIGFAIFYFMDREMKPAANTPIKKCPECDELIQAEAKKCHYCGVDLVSNK